MPYGCAGSQTLSRASRIGLEKAIDWWQKSMQTSRHKTYFILAGYSDDGGQELALRRALVQQTDDPELLANLVEVIARNEEALAQKIARTRRLLPVETITVFVETRNAVSVRAIFRRKFGKTLQIRKFQASFEFNHEWVSTSTSLAWFSRNWLLRVWFEAKRRTGRRLRKKIRLLFRA